MRPTEEQTAAAASAEFFSHMSPPEGSSAPAIYFGVRDGDVLVEPLDDSFELPSAPPAGTPHVLGSLGERPCIAVDVEGTPESPLQWRGLRDLYGHLPDRLWSLAGRALQIVQWDRTHRFCGRCGSPTTPQEDERARSCSRCGLVVYPRLSPAIIVLVTRNAGQEALLAWGRRSPTPRYSTLAGFVEPGETLEEAVMREVREESGIEVGEITYFASQPWPFPHQLMIGFRASYRSGELAVQESEIVEARWFRPEELAEITASRGRMSISGWLIEGWLAERVAAPGPAGR